MTFRKKMEYIIVQKPDILIIPECECPEKLNFNRELPMPTDMFWFGRNPNKGLGVFSYNGYKLSFIEERHDQTIKTFLPFYVTNEKVEFLLLAIWVNKDSNGAYVTQLWKAIHAYSDLLEEQNVLLVGDFNSNVIWDKFRKEGNHAMVVENLRSKNIISTYHHLYKQEQGKENHPTLFMYRRKDRSYHIDYCFASNSFIEKLKNVEIGIYEDWKYLSDHMPLTVNFDL